jgi:parallel beta-helix repeat protein
MQHQSQSKPATASKVSATVAPAGMLQRKCACGNHTMAGGECSECSKNKRLGLRTKLTVNEPGDIYEQEADRIADQVMATPTHPAVNRAPPRIQRFSGQSNGQMDAAPASVDRVLASSGRPLEPALQQDMEQRFGHDFSRVRVHSSGAAEQSAREVNAHAYTVGHNVVFGASRFMPETHEGRRLIAHELTHVVQSGRSLQRQPASNACPNTVTTNRTLTSNCSGGIVVGADNITLDCSGHTLTGSGRGTPIALVSRTGVTVRNCKMDNFNEGVTLRNSNKNIFISNTVNNNIRDGFDLNTSHENTFFGNTITSNHINGIELDDSNENNIVLNDVQNNGQNNGDNISLDRSNGNKFVSNNVLRSNQAGFHLDQDSNQNTFIFNAANNNQRDGFRIDDHSDQNTFISNAANNNQRDGFRIVNSDDNIFILNTANTNGSDDIDLRSGANNKCINNNFTHPNCPP